MQKVQACLACVVLISPVLRLQQVKSYEGLGYVDRVFRQAAAGQRLPRPEPSFAACYMPRIPRSNPASSCCCIQSPSEAQHYFSQYQRAIPILWRALSGMSVCHPAWEDGEGPAALKGRGAALQEVIVKKTAAALEAEGLAASGTCVSASDETNIDVSLANMRAYQPATMAAVGQINTHAYWVRTCICLPLTNDHPPTQ